MRKSRYINQITVKEWQQGSAFMRSEMQNICDIHVRKLLQKAIRDFEAGKFSYDGATFVKERTNSMFEASAFIHDWRNSMGYVSYKVDREMLDIMILLDYNLSLINWRWFLTRFTIINIARHKILRSYVGSAPADLYRLPKMN